MKGQGKVRLVLLIYHRVLLHFTNVNCKVQGSDFKYPGYYFWVANLWLVIIHLLLFMFWSISSLKHSFRVLTTAPHQATNTTTEVHCYPVLATGGRLGVINSVSSASCTHTATLKLSSSQSWAIRTVLLRRKTTATRNAHDLNKKQ